MGRKATVSDRSRAKGSKPSASLVDWAKGTKRNTGGVQCGVCRHPEVVADIQALLEYRRAGNPTPGLPQVWRELVARHPDAGITWHSLIEHIRGHAGGWSGRS